MAFKFNALLQFNSGPAKKALSEAGAQFRNLEKSIKKAQASLSGVSHGVGAAGAALLPFTAGVGFAVKTAADFEQKMSKIQALMLTSKEDMIPLENIIRSLGRSTVFSAGEVADAAEMLGQAGFTMDAIGKSLPGVLDAAAVSGATMAEVADVVASNLGAFGMKAEQATEIADGLALASVISNAKFQDLAEGLSYAQTSAKAAGMTFKDTVSAIAVMANAGLKGSSAGTALTNMLIQLSKPSKEAIKLFGSKQGLSAALMQVGKDGKMQLRPMEVIMANIAQVVSKAKDPMDAVARAAELMGVRGQKAFSTFQGQMLGTTQITNQNRETLLKGAAAAKELGENWDKEIASGVIPTLVAMRLQLLGSEGTAKKMAAIRMDNFLGAWEMLKGAVEDVSIGVGKLLLPDLTKMFREGANAVEAIGLGFTAAFRGSAATKDELAGIAENMRPLVVQAMEFGQGFIQGFKEFRTEAMAAFEGVRSFLQPFLGDVGKTNQDVGRLVAKFLFWGAVAGPILVAIAGGFALMAPILGSIVSLFSLATSTFGILKASMGIGVSIINFLLGVFGSKLTVAIMMTKGLAVAGSTAMAILTSPITLVIAAIGLLAAGIYGVWARWDEVKQAFADRGFFAALWVGIKSFALGIWDVISWPFFKLKDMFLSLIGWIAKTTAKLGFGILSGAASWLLGGDKTTTAPAGATLPTPPPTIKDAQTPKIINDGVNAQMEAFRLQEESLKQKSIVQPASADANAEALAARIPAASGGAGGGGKTDVNVQLQGEFKLKGQDLNLVVTRSQVSQAERNGKTIAPERKRQMLTNGAPLPAGG